MVPDQYHSPDDTTFVLDRRANATIVMLARNGDLQGVVKSVKQMEDRFNKRFRYPYVFLNEEPFTDQFKTCGASCVSVYTSPTDKYDSTAGG
jgi:alpha 1,2-mannosyltransferase